MSWNSATNGWGPVERDHSNGETAPGDGRTLTINGTTYAKGLGVNSPSDIQYSLNGGCSTFTAVVGVDDEIGSRGNVVFQVWADGTKKFDSGVLTGAMGGQAVSVAITGVNVLELVVSIGSDGVNYYDHGDWADAKVTCGGTDTSGLIAIQAGQSIQAAINAAPEGAGFLIKAGTYRFQTITPKHNQTFVGETGAIISGGRVLTGFSRSGSAWVVSGQTQQGAFIASSGSCRTSDPKCNYPEDLFFDNVPLERVSSLGAGGSGKWFFDYGAHQIYVWDDPSGRNVETSVTPQAFGGYANNVTLRNLIVEKYATPTATAAIAPLGTGWLFDGNEVRWNHFGGIDPGGFSTSQNNYVHDNGSLGFQGAGQNLLIENNEMARNGYAGYTPFWCAGGTKFVLTQNLTVRGNYSHDNLGPGLWTDIDNIYTLFENNIVEDNERGGIFHELSYDATIRYNTIRRNGTGQNYPYWSTGAGIEVMDSKNVEAYGNTLVDNWQGMTGTDDQRGGSGAYGTYELLNMYIHDNTVTTTLTIPGSGRTGIVTESNNQAFTAAANNRFRHNTYFLGTNAKYFFWMSEDDENQWRASGQDQDGSFNR